MNLQSELVKILTKYTLDPFTNKKFTQRIFQGKFVQGQNPSSHFCLYFAAYDKLNKEVFLGHHKKSGLWLFNGGHIDENENLITTLTREINEEWGYKKIPAHIEIYKPDLITVTPISNQIQPCKEHFDIWYFINMSKNTFTPSDHNLKVEFFAYKWLNFSEARNLVKDPATLQAIAKMQKMTG